MNQPIRQSRASPDPQEEELDAEIASIRAEIHKLQRRKRFLASSLLSSETIQSLLRKPPPALTSIYDEVSPLARAAGKHSDTNHFRIAFGTTAFPFQDPSPTATGDNLLGVRIDICARNGRFAKPYYVILRRERGRGENVKRFRVYRHTVPAFISLSKLESVYLPFPGTSQKARGDGEGESDSEAEDGEVLKPRKGERTRKQDLRGFVRELRRELVAWHLRSDAVDLLRERLGLGETEQSSPSESENGTGIVSLASTAIETRYVRLEWEDGRVGRFKLSNAGIVERAVVIGDKGRDQRTEEAMTGGGGRVETLLERLRKRGSSAA